MRFLINQVDGELSSVRIICSLSEQFRCNPSAVSLISIGSPRGVDGGRLCIERNTRVTRWISLRSHWDKSLRGVCVCVCVCVCVWGARGIRFYRSRWVSRANGTQFFPPFSFDSPATSTINGDARSNVPATPTFEPSSATPASAKDILAIRAYVPWLMSTHLALGNCCCCFAS